MYKQLNVEEYAKFRKSLLREKGSNQQRDFLYAAQNNDGFVEFVRNSVCTEGNIEIPVISENLSESEYKECPIDTEVKLYTAWEKITPETACRVSFWGEVTLRHIEEGKNDRLIKAYYLAANGGALSGGQERIDKSLSNQGSIKEIDSCVRTILRRMSGLPEARGNRTQYVDCPFGRAWWRTRLSNEIADESLIHVDKIRNLLHLQQVYWEELVTLVVSRNSILGDRKVRDALIWNLAEILEKKNKAKDHNDEDHNYIVLKSTYLRVLCRLLGIRCAWQEMGILELVEIKELIGDEIESLNSGIKSEDITSSLGSLS